MMYRTSPYLSGNIRRLSVLTLFIGAVLLLHSTALAQNDDDPADAVATFNSAQDLHEKGDLAGAIELYKKALKIMPEFPEAEYQCGIAHLALGQSAEAVASFRRAVELRADWTLALTSLGSLLVQNGQFDEAERILSKVIELEPLNSSALAAMTELRLKTKASPAVLTDLLAKVTNLTTKANPTASIWSARAALEIALGKSDVAEASIASALKIDPKNRAALIQAAEMASHSTDPIELEKQLETDAKNPVILGRLCSLYRLPNPAKALEYCRRASEAEPSNVDHAVGFGAALVQAKRFADAVNLLRKTLEIAPDNSTAHANLATALFELKRYREAKTEYEWLTNSQPQLAAAWYFLAITHDQLGEYADALAGYQQYLRLADPAANKLDIEKVNLRLPALRKKVKTEK